MRLNVVPTHYQGQVEIRPRRALYSLYARTGAVGEESRDRGSSEEIVAHSHYQIVGVFPASGTRIEKANRPRTRLSVKPRTSENRNRCAGRGQSDAPRVKKLHSTRCPDVKQPARLEEEFPLLRKEERKPGEIDHLLVRLDLSKIGIDREVRCHSR